MRPKYALGVRWRVVPERVLVLLQLLEQALLPLVTPEDQTLEEQAAVRSGGVEVLYLLLLPDMVVYVDNEELP
jgi:hypothetical protein